MWGNRKMQEQSINLKALWERPPKPTFRDMGTEDLPPLIGKGYLALYRRFDLEDPEDYPRDRMQRICINFAGVSTAGFERIEEKYTLAGVSLFGESTGNPLMPITYARYGVVNYRNTGNTRIEAGDDVYFMVPTPRMFDRHAFPLAELGNARVAITVPGHTFDIRNELGGLFDAGDYLQSSVHFVGRSLLAADPGMIGTLFMSG
jgi:hypothetical protein